MYTEITTPILIVIVLILALALFINGKNNYEIPWTRIAQSTLQRLLLLKPNIIKSWEHCPEYHFFRNDSSVVIVVDNPKGHPKIRPGASLFLGSSTQYDVYAIIRVRSLGRDVYILDVDCLGSGSNKSGYELKYTL